MTAEEVYESVTNGGTSDFAAAVATLNDVVQGKIWAWQDKERRLTKRKKDELDLLRLAEAHPALQPAMPREIVQQLQGDER